MKTLGQKNFFSSDIDNFKLFDGMYTYVETKSDGLLKQYYNLRDKRYQEQFPNYHPGSIDGWSLCNNSSVILALINNVVVGGMTLNFITRPTDKLPLQSQGKVDLPDILVSQYRVAQMGRLVVAKNILHKRVICDNLFRSISILAFHYHVDFMFTEQPTYRYPRYNKIFEDIQLRMDIIMDIDPPKYIPEKGKIKACLCLIDFRKKSALEEISLINIPQDVPYSIQLRASL